MWAGKPEEIVQLRLKNISFESGFDTDEKASDYSDDELAKEDEEEEYTVADVRDVSKTLKMKECLRYRKRKVLEKRRRMANMKKKLMRVKGMIIRKLL